MFAAERQHVNHFDKNADNGTAAVDLYGGPLVALTVYIAELNAPVPTRNGGVYEPDRFDEINDIDKRDYVVA